MSGDNPRKAINKAKAWKQNSGIDPEIQSPSAEMQLPSSEIAAENISIYHGTSSEAAEKIKQAGFWNKFDVSLYGGGIYGTGSSSQAERYATMKGGKTGKVLELSVNPSELEDLGQFPTGNREAIDKLYAKARSLRQEGKSLLIRGHARYGDLAILDPELATRSLI